MHCKMLKSLHYRLSLISKGHQITFTGECPSHLLTIFYFRDFPRPKKQIHGLLPMTVYTINIMSNND